jgi:nitroreductase
MQENNVILEHIYSRRSVKQYTNEPVSEAALQQIVKAGQYAPTGRNLMATKFVVVQNPEIRNQLSAMNASIMGVEKDPFYGAPVVIWVLADRTVHTYVEDGSLAMGNLLLAAHALGLGSCWIHRAKEMSELPEGRALLQQWDIPDTYIGVGCCIVGHTDGVIPEQKPRKTDQVVVVA